MISSTLQLQNDLLRNCQVLPDDQFISYLFRWTTSFQPLPPPVGTAACKQRSWDAPFVESSFATLLASQPDEYSRARLLAAAAPHGGDWLHVLPISSCRLRLDDDAIRVAIGLRLGANLCDPHVYPCGTFVNSRGTHCLFCKRGSSKLTRHAIINNLVHRALVRARIPSIMEPMGLSHSDGKRPDGLTLVPWSAGEKHHLEDPRETSLSFQRISVAVQRFNAIRIRDSFPIQVNID